MEYIKRPFAAAWQALVTPFRHQAEDRQITTYDVYMEHILDVLLWEDKKVTVRYFVFINQFVWLVLMLNLKLLGTLSLITLIAFLADRFYRDRLYVTYTGRHRQLIENIEQLTPELWQILCNLRKNSGALFVMVMSLAFMWLNLVSRIITGTWLVVLFITMMFSVPVALKSLNKNWLSRILPDKRVDERRVLAEEELIPFIADKDLDSKDPELDSLLTDKTADSVSTSLTAGLGAMPSYLEVAGVVEELQEEDLLPRGPASPPSVPSSDSDDGGGSANGVHFDSDHFAGSSSEEEAQLARGLLGEGTRNRSKDSDSDFEIVNTEDLDD